jgi:hypothetical protein
MFGRPQYEMQCPLSNAEEAQMCLDEAMSTWSRLKRRRLLKLAQVYAALAAAERGYTSIC